MRRARALMPGGVSSPVRAFNAVGGDPPVFTSGRGCRLVDEDGREYIDFVLAYGPLILGHDHPAVRAALAERVPLGTAYGGPTALEGELAGRGGAARAAVEVGPLGQVGPAA